MLALEELHATLAINTLYSARTGDIIELLQYVYGHTSERKEVAEGLRNMMMRTSNRAVVIRFLYSVPSPFLVSCDSPSLTPAQPHSRFMTGLGSSLARDVSELAVPDSVI